MNRPNCPTPTKRAYLGESDAMRALGSIAMQPAKGSARTSRKRRKPYVRGAYECRCGLWHLTSQTKEKA